MKSPRIVAFAKGCDLAEGLLNGGEAGLLHLRTISQIVGRKIRVWDGTGKVLGIFSQQNSSYHQKGDEDIPQKINTLTIPTNFAYYWTPKNTLGESYLELQYEYLEDGKVRHWQTKVNENDSERIVSPFKNDNNCLFDAICQQCDFEPANLRVMTAKKLRQEIFIVEDVFPQFSGAGILLLGGAKYNGKNAEDARIILDNSQGTRGEGHAAVAHPRGHASHPSATRSIDSVERYSMGSTRDFPKSAWMSRAEQNESVHRLLMTTQAQMAMESLNTEPVSRIILKLYPSFEILVGLWAEGVMFRGPLKADMVTVILQHHRGQADEPNADVQVFTCYPVAPRGSEKEEMSLPPEPTLKRSLPPSEDDDDDVDDAKRAKQES